MIHHQYPLSLVIPSVTPEGVEHDQAVAGAATSGRVIPSVTPEGVEHLLAAYRAEDALDVIPSVTPEGVEHIDAFTAPAVGRK